MASAEPAEPARSRPESPQMLQGSVRLGEIELGGVELVTHPDEVVVVLLVLAVGDRLEALLISARAADVLGRAGVLSVDADGVLQGEIWPGRRLDHHLVVPGV